MREIPPAAENTRTLAFTVNELIRGRSNAVGEVTLTPNATTTVVTNPNFNEGSYAFFSPLTSNAAGAIVNVYAIVTRGSMTIHHVNLATTDRTYGYIVLGG